MTTDELDCFFASDLGAEVRREYDLRASHGVPTAEATRDVLAIFRDLLTDPHDGPVVFIALAALQLRQGSVLPFIRETALDLIQTGEARRAYASDNFDVTQQRKVLLAAMEKALE